MTITELIAKFTTDGVVFINNSTSIDMELASYQKVYGHTIGNDIWNPQSPMSGFTYGRSSIDGYIKISGGK